MKNEQENSEKSQKEELLVPMEQLDSFEFEFEDDEDDAGFFFEFEPLED